MNLALTEDGERAIRRGRLISSRCAAQLAAFLITHRVLLQVHAEFICVSLIEIPLAALPPNISRFFRGVARCRAMNR